MKVTGKSNQARARLGLSALPVTGNKRKGPTAHDQLIMRRVILRGAARNYSEASEYADHGVPEREAAALDAAALQYARDLLAHEFETHGWQPPTDVLATLDRYVKALSR